MALPERKSGSQISQLDIDIFRFASIREACESVFEELKEHPNITEQHEIIEMCVKGTLNPNFLNLTINREKF